MTHTWCWLLHRVHWKNYTCISSYYCFRVHNYSLHPHSWLVYRTVGCTCDRWRCFDLLLLLLCCWLIGWVGFGNRSLMMGHLIFLLVMGWSSYVRLLIGVELSGTLRLLRWIVVSVGKLCAGWWSISCLIGFESRDVWVLVSILFRLLFDLQACWPVYG